MKTFSQMASILLVSTCFGACANVGVTRLGDPVAARPEHCKLQVFAGTEEVKRAYTSVCLLDSHAGMNVAEAVDAARDAACACGADAIIIEQGNVSTEYRTTYSAGPYTPFPGGRYWGPAPTGVSAYERGNATLRAIKYNTEQ